MTGQTSDATRDYVFCPPPKGDITLRSSDGIEFQSHSPILNLASSVFESLSIVGTSRDVVELSEDAATLSIMLRFIYPNTRIPVMTSFEVLVKCLHAAQKYDLEGMLGTIDDQLAGKTGPRSLIHEDPLRLHQLALQFNLTNAKVAAAQLAMTSKTNFCDPLRVSELARTYSSASVVHLAAIQGTRTTILADVLLNFYKQPILPGPELYAMFFNLSCRLCRKSLEECKESSLRKGLYSNLPPSWVLAWADFTYQVLRVTPLEHSEELFDVSILEKLEGKSNVCQECLLDFAQIRSLRRTFNLWAQTIKEVLKQRLEGIHEYYAL